MYYFLSAHEIKLVKKSIYNPYLVHSKSSQCISISYYGSKFNVYCGTFDGDDELIDEKLLDDDNLDESSPISNFEDKKSAIGSSAWETL